MFESRLVNILRGFSLKCDFQTWVAIGKDCSGNIIHDTCDDLEILKIIVLGESSRYARGMIVPVYGNKDKREYFKLELYDLN